MKKFSSDLCSFLIFLNEILANIKIEKQEGREIR